MSERSRSVNSQRPPTQNIAPFGSFDDIVALISKPRTDPT